MSNVTRCESIDFWNQNSFCKSKNKKSFLVGETSTKTVVVDNPYSKKQGANQLTNKQDTIVQMRPQNYHVKLRKGDKKELTFRFKLADDYPVDLYYLMDLSQSMADDLANLRKQGEIIADTLKELTSDLYMGFGSFVDKPVMPFVNTLEERLENPCLSSNKDKHNKVCARPYAFNNTFPLSNNIESFKSAVSQATHSSNLDAPEGGLEAMMQAIVCTDKIKWRSGENQRATKFIVYSSDAGFHTAGDGKLAGIVIPNDMACHTDDKGYYDAAEKQDYPSVGQIRYQLRKHDIQPIFAVTKHVQDVYKSLASLISDRSEVGELKSDSSNIVDLIKKAYTSLRSKVSISAESVVGGIKISQGSAYCEGIDGPMTEGLTCENVKLSQEIVFKVEIEATECIDENQSTQLSFQAEGYSSDKTLVNIQTLCDCDCDNNESLNEQDDQCRRCSDNGEFKCGICECFQDYGGKCCNCKITSRDDYKKFEKQCKRPGSLQICSGRGECICGECVCHKQGDRVIQGKHCHCDNVSCPRKNNELCSGNGQCNCGTCKCNEGWSGDDCGCTEDVKTCKAAGSDEICSGVGECKCGNCKCQSTKQFHFVDTHCQRMITNCQEHTECILEYAVSGTEAFEFEKSEGNRSESVGSCNGKYKVNNVKIGSQIEANTGKTGLGDDWRPCRATLDGKLKDGAFEGCWIQYYIFENKTDERNADGVMKMDIRWEKFNREHHCPFEIQPAMVLGIVGGAVLLLGLLLLALWKALMMYLDWREYKTFEDEFKKLKHWKEDNPLYVPAEETTQNPLIQKKK